VRAAREETMLQILFILAVVVGFILWFLASWPTPAS
jgi:hypothetical protein